MSLIHLLPDALINQIAAGEVVERPASVVKELVENSIDAGATRVHIRLAAGGRDLVDVEDDGSGMDHDDALLALERHATSKLRTAADLERLATLGFRGEALPSIAAVSRLLIETAAVDGEGTRVEVDLGRIRSVEPQARPRGTRVSVRDLFGHVPARRKFLRTEATELRHVLTTVTGLAFANPALGLTLDHGKRRLLDAPPVREAGQRLTDLVGTTRASLARPFRQASGRMAVHGLLMPPTPGHELIVVVNGRLVRDRILSGAINRALRGSSGLIEADLFLHLTLDPATVDVNVHPTKAEVRFAEPNAVVSLLTRALAAARAASHGPGELRRVVPVPPATTQVHWPQTPSERPTYQVPLFTFSVAETGTTSAAQVAPTAIEPRALPRWGRLIGQYRATYLLLEDDEGLLLIDQHAAHERVLFERLLGTSDGPATHRLLLPEVVELPVHLAALAEATAPALGELGIEIEPASSTTIRVLSIPATLRAAASGALVHQLLTDLHTAAVPGASLRERAAASLACQAAIKKNWPLSTLEAENLILELAELSDPHRCPHGRPTMLRLAHAEIERRIGRR